MRYPLVKTKGRKQYLEELSHYEMPKVYASVNALQSTKWRINKAVLGVMREAWEANMQVAKLPPREPLPLPPDAPSDCTPEELAAVKASKARVYTENVRIMSKRLSMGAKLWLADKFSAYERHLLPARARLAWPRVPGGVVPAPAGRRHRQGAAGVR
jgi:DNA-directed RNA polymerase